MRLLALCMMLAVSMASDAAAGARAVAKCDPLCTFDLVIDGAVTSETAKEVRAIVAQYTRWRKANPGNVGVMARINSPGGDVKAAMDIGRSLRTHSFPIEVKEGHMCVSACVLILAGAVDRLIGGSVGVHRPYFSDTRRGRVHADVHESYRDILLSLRQYLLAMNVRESLADDMLRVEPAQMKILSGAELEAYGLNKRDPAYQEYLDINEAAEYGLQRTEFIRRKSVAERECRPVAIAAAWRACYDAIMKQAK